MDNFMAPGYFAPYNSPWGPARPQMNSGANDIEGVRWVSCKQEVDGTSLPFGAKALFMSSAENEFWIKSIGQNGVPTVRHFKYEEILPPNPDDFVTREEMNRQIEAAIARYTNGELNIPAATPAASSDQQGASIAIDEIIPGDTGAGQAAVLRNGGESRMDQAATQ